MRTPGAEDFYLQAGANYIAELFLATFASWDYGDSTTSADCLDELAVDDAKHYKAKISKWIKAALNATCDVMFWYMMHTAQRTRAPLLHFYRWLCSKSRPGRMPIVELVSRRSESIRSEFCRLVSSFPTWTNEAIVFAQSFSNTVKKTIEDSPRTDPRTLRDISAKLLLQNASCFTRRVVHVYQRPLA